MILEAMLKEVRKIPGWFEPIDVAAFVAVWEVQREASVQGDILEIGAYEGKSAVVLGHMLRPNETFLVCDLFDLESDTEEVRAEWRHHYAGLTQRRFEQNYLSIHDRLPSIHRGPSRELAALNLGRTFRIIHVDGSHLYEQVVEDVQICRDIAVTGAIVVFDDIARVSTPGVAAAVWREVTQGGLRPLLLTRNKLYASWSPLPDATAQLQRACSRLEMRTTRQRVDGQDLLICAEDYRRNGFDAVARNWIPPIAYRARRIVMTRWAKR